MCNLGKCNRLLLEILVSQYFYCNLQSGIPISLCTLLHLHVRQDHKQRIPFATSKFIRPFCATTPIIRITQISPLAALQRTRNRSVTFLRIQNYCAICPNTAIIRNTPPAVLRPRSSPSATSTSQRDIRASFAILCDIRIIRNTAIQRRLDNNPIPSVTYPVMF